MLFADDTLIFCKDSREEMAFLSWTLMWFESIFGLRVDLEISYLLPMGEVAVVGSLPTYYLGLPLGANHELVTT